MTETISRKASSTSLTEDLVATLRSLHKVYGHTPTQLSDEYKVPRTTVRDILNRRTWAHLPKGLLSWTGEHPHHPGAEAVTSACGQVYPQDNAKWCSRGNGHVGSHMWLDPRLMESEQVAWLALEMLALIDKLDPPVVPEEPCPTPEPHPTSDGTSSNKELSTTTS